MIRLSQALGLTAVLLAALVAGGVLHANTPAARRLTAALLTRELSSAFSGTITVGGVEHLSPYGVIATDLRVQDPNGATVLVLSDLKIKVDAIELADKYLFGESKVTLVVRHVRAERAEVFVIPDAKTGIPTIAAAFTPVPSAPTAPSTPSGPSRYIRAWLPEVEIGRVYARGRVAELPTMEVQLSNVRGSVLGTPKGAAIDVKRYGMVVRGLGGTDATGTGDIHIRAPGAVWTSFDGFFGNLSAGAFLYVKGDEISATLDLPRANPEDVRGLWVDYPLKQPVTAHVEASGALPNLQTSSRFEIGDTRIAASGPLRLSGNVGVNLDVEGRSVDLRALWPNLPKTKVDVDSAISVWNKKGQVVVDVNGTTAATHIAGYDVPAVDVNGTFNEKGFEGKATAHEEGMPLKVDFTVHPDGAVDVDAHARTFALQKAPRVRELTGARGTVDMRVKARIEKNQLDASLTADVSGLDVQDVHLGKGQVSGHAKGPLTQPDKLSIDARLSGSRLAASGLSFDRVKATAHGNVLRPKVTAELTDSYGPNVNASATVDVGKKSPRVDNLKLEVEREGAALSGKIARLDLGKQEVFIQDLKLAGAGGNLSGSVLVRPDHVEVKAKGEGLDLDRIARALGLPRGTLGGKLVVDADVVATKRESRGRVMLALGNGSIASLSGISLRVNADLDDRHFQGSASALVQDIGAFGAAWEAELGGHAVDEKSWREITGLGEIQMNEIDLALLTYLLPPEAHVEEVRGKAFGRLRVERSEPDAIPNVGALAGTKDLAVTVSPGEPGEGEPIKIEGIDLQASTGILGETGDSSATLIATDEGGQLAMASGSVHLDLPAIIKAPKKILDFLKSTPIVAVLSVPDRSLAALPEFIRPKGVSGTVGGKISFNGTPLDPRLGTTVDLTDLSSTSSRLALPVSIHGTGQYEPKSGRFAGTAELSQGRSRVAWLLTKGEAPWGSGSWNGGAQLIFERTPLGVIPPLADSHVGGTLTGTLAIQRPAGTVLPLATANIDIHDASVDMVPVGSGSLFLRSDGHTATARARMDNRGGHIEVNAGGGVRWSGPLPDLDTKRPLLLGLEAKSYSAAVLSPFLTDVFSRLGGRVDGDLKATLVAEEIKGEDGKPDVHWTGKVLGWASMTRGVMQIAPLGMDIRDISFRAEARDAGRFTALEITNVQGKARSETDNVKAAATLYLDGLRLERGNGWLRLVDVPLLVQGVPQASARGLATLELEREKDRMVVTATVPSLEARLPRASARSVIELGDNPAIDVEQPLREPTEEHAGAIMPWHFVVNLGKDVKITRNDMNILLTGQPVVDLADKVKVTGYVELEAGGRMQALGKTFVIESGRVMFDTGEPADPHVNVTASWRAPDGSTVYVDVQGTLKDARLKLSSDPARPEQEVMALLLGGGGTSSEESSSSGARAAAGGVAAGGLATALNALLSDALVGQVEIRTATYENTSSYTAAVRISDTVWFEGTYRSTATDTTQTTAGADRVDVSGTVDWRFRKNWSLRTEIGTVGTGLDLLWQYRY
ncbi:MAG: translocation/assembly module TamB domain-containing protein [Polyangiaceae bacterium]|nr:translocation/assembly module TamB domain-containing protein [Polyangiaceae bacterium]